MNRTQRFLLPGLLALLTGTFATAAEASCSTRPGTPNEVQARATSPSSIEFSWRNTTGRGIEQLRMYFDISLTDQNGYQVGSMTGVGPYDGLTYGSRSTRVVSNLTPNQTLCFVVRARTGSGTNGCVSQIFSNKACATTPAAQTAVRPVHQFMQFLIGVEKEPGNVFHIKGYAFLPNARATIRVADDALHVLSFTQTPDGKAIMSDSGGRLDVRLGGICTQPGSVYFSANDGRTSHTDRTGTRWTNTVRLSC